MSDLVFLYAKLQLHWGFIVRQAGASAAQLAYPLPPPTTVIGAFANPLGRLLDMPDAMPYEPGRKRKRSTALPVTNRFMECMLKAVKTAGAGLDPEASTGVVVFEEPSRITGTPYKGGGSYDKAVKKPIYLSVQELLPVQAVGSASAPGVRLIIGALLDVDALSTCIGKKIDYDLLEMAVWGAHRLGSREGLASVVDAWVSVDLENIESGSFMSLLYQKATCAKPARPDLVVETVMTNELYQSTSYYVPASPASSSAMLTPPLRQVLFSLRGGCKAVWPRGYRNLALSMEK